MKLFNILSVATLSLAGSALLTGCSKDDRLMYEQDARVYFYNDYGFGATDSLAYTFGVKDVSRQEDTFYLHLRIMGDMLPYDRAVNIVVDDSSTAREGIDFDFGEKIIHANNYEDSVAVYLHKNEDLKTNIFELFLSIGASEDFQPGYVSMDGFYGQLTYRISVTDQLTKPARWDSYYANYFGTYSKVKFQFIISVSGRTDWTSTPYPAEMTYIIQQVKLALAEYEATNGSPLLDENGEEVVIP